MSSVFPGWSLAISLAGLLAIGCGNGDTTGGSGGDSAGSTGASPPVTTAPTLGDEHQGDYNLGPVAFEGSFTNSCAPYTPDLEAAAGPYLAGLGLDFNGKGQLCDACILLTTRLGKSIVAHVITTGSTVNPNDVDLSQAAYDAIYEPDPQGTSEHPRPMKWQIARCPVTGNVEYQFQTAANPDWTSLWVRNMRVPVTTLEVKSARHADWFALTRGPDGTLTDAGGFGDGPLTLRATSLDAQQITDDFPAIQAGAVVTGSAQFQ